MGGAYGTFRVSGEAVIKMAANRASIRATGNGSWSASRRETLSRLKGRPV